jgi:hypothetical protein
LAATPPPPQPPAQPAAPVPRPRRNYPITLEEVNLSFINDTPGIGVGHEWLFIPVEHLIGGRASENLWRFRIRDLRNPPATECAWVSLREVQLLSTSTVARQFRSCLEAEFGGTWRTALDYLILRIQENEGRFIRQAPQQEAEDEEEVVEQFRVNLSADELEEVENILNSPNAIERINTPHLDNIVSGENDNKQVIFTTLLSGKSPNPKMKQMILIKGRAGGGKSTLMNIANLYRYKEVGRFTKHALDYSSESFRGIEVLKLKEFGNADDEKEGVSVIKFLSADDNGYNVEYVVRDEATGRMRTETSHIPPLTIISSTNRVDIDEQYTRRNWILNPDESAEQTERVRQWTAKDNNERAYVSLGILAETSKERSTRILMGLLDRIPPCEVIVPFADALTSILEANNLRVRGDYGRLITLVQLYGILIQRSLPNVTREDGTVIVVMTPERAIEVLNLAMGPLTTMTSSLEQRDRRIINLLKEHNCDIKGAAIDKTLRDTIATHSGLTSESIRLYLNQLENSGYMTSEEGPQRRKTWYLLYSLEELERKLSSVSDKLKKPRGIIEKMWNETLAWAQAIANANQPADQAAPAPTEAPSQDSAAHRLEVSQSLSDAFTALIPHLEAMRTAQLQVLADAEAEMPPEPERLEVHIQAQLGGETLGGTGKLTGTIMERLDTLCQWVASESLVLDTVTDEQIAAHFESPIEEVGRLLDVIRRDSGAPIFSPRPGRWRGK